MPQATIVVATIAPRPGKKQGHVIDSNGGKWNVWNDKLHNYRAGVAYDITYEENDFNGTKFYVIKNADPSGQQSSSGQGGGPGVLQPRPSTSPAAPVYPTAKDEAIFVCGALNNAIANPNVQPMILTVTELATFVSTLRQVWRGTLGAPKPQAAAQQQQNPMDDEIPF